jgi:hypothetical protein
MEGEKKRGWLTLWCALAFAMVFIVYPLSIGPALWISGWLGMPWLEQAVNVFYTPALFVWERLPETPQTWYAEYIMWWARDFATG